MQAHRSLGLGCSRPAPHREAAVLCLAVALLHGCGSPPAAQTAEAPVEETAPAATARGPSPASSETEPDTNANPKAAEPAASSEPVAPAPSVPVREVIYTVSPDGLTIDIEGARFKPRAKVVKQANGGFGIELEVAAEAKDDRNHTLLSPQLGPLAISARVFDKSDKELAHYADRRIGDGQELLLPGNPLVLRRSWPSGEVKGPLWWGQKVHIDVGLWGFGTDSAEGRPVKKLFVVEMVAGAKAQAVISPPDVK